VEERERRSLARGMPGGIQRHIGSLPGPPAAAFAKPAS